MFKLFIELNMLFKAVKASPTGANYMGYKLEDLIEAGIYCLSDLDSKETADLKDLELYVYIHEKYLAS